MCWAHSDRAWPNYWMRMGVRPTMPPPVPTHTLPPAHRFAACALPSARHSPLRLLACCEHVARAMRSCRWVAAPCTCRLQRPRPGRPGRPHRAATFPPMHGRSAGMNISADAGEDGLSWRTCITPGSKWMRFLFVPLCPEALPPAWCTFRALSFRCTLRSANFAQGCVHTRCAHQEMVRKMDNGEASA